MKMKKKNIFIMFILIFTLALLGGCGTKNVRVLITLS
jgi:predicted small lipoprotein YifL